MNQDRSASNVSGMWMTILQHCFPVRSVSHVPEFSSGRGYGRSDIISIKWRRDNGNVYKQRPFLITQTKSPRYETWQSVWTGAENQLLGYLTTAAARNIGRCHYIWGIVAIGRKVKVYQYSRITGIMTVITGPTPLHVDNDAQLVRSTLANINRRSQF